MDCTGKWSIQVTVVQNVKRHWQFEPAGFKIDGCLELANLDLQHAENITTLLAVAGGGGGMGRDDWNSEKKIMNMTNVIQKEEGQFYTYTTDARPGNTNECYNSHHDTGEQGSLKCN